MEKNQQGLIVALALKSREHIAIVGGGGKTTLMTALAKEFKSRGRRVLLSTTTKIRHEEAQRFPVVMRSETGPGRQSRLATVLAAEGWAFVGEKRGSLGKIIGISPSAADRLFNEASPDCLVVEADGAAGRPVKVPADHEPVIPESATLVVAMMGLEALERHFDPDTVFRGDEFAALTGLQPGERLTPRVLAKVFQASGGLFKGAPGSARRAVFLNKLDLLKAPRLARTLAELLTEPAAGGVARAVAGSLRNGKYPLVSAASGLGSAVLIDRESS